MNTIFRELVTAVEHKRPRRGDRLPSLVHQVSVGHAAIQASVQRSVSFIHRPSTIWDHQLAGKTRYECRRTIVFLWIHVAARCRGDAAFLTAADSC